MKQLIIKFLVRVLPRSLALRVAKADGEVTKFLLKTAEVLRTGGWRRGDFGAAHDLNARHCYIGAMRAVAASERPDCMPVLAYARHRVYAEARSAVMADIGEVPHWNDDARRTAEEVIEHAENTALANVS